MQKDKILLLLILLFVLRHIFFYNNDLIYHEEGQRLYIYSSIADGDIYYKDVSFQHGFFPPYFYGAIFKIFGKELSYVRATSLLVTLISIVIVFWLGTKLIPAKWAAFISFLSFGAYFMPFYGYGYPVSNCMGYISILFITLFIYNKKNLYFFLSIFFCSLTFLHNPYQEGFSFFTSIFMGLIIYWWYSKEIKNNFKHLLLFPTCIITLYIIFNLYFLIKVNFNLRDFIPFGYGRFPSPFKNIAILHILEILKNIFPQSFSISHMYFFLKTFLFIILSNILPIICFIVGILYFLKNKITLYKKGFIILIITFLSLTSPVRAYFFGSTGRSDAFGIAPSIFLSLYFLYLFLQSIKVKLPKYERIIIYSAVSLLLLIYIFIQIPGLNPTYAKVELNIKGVRGIKVGTEEAKMINELTKFIFDNTSSNDKLMELSLGGEFFAYLTDRELLFKDDLVFYYPLTHNIDDLTMSKEAFENLKRNVIEKIQTEKPKLIILPHSDWYKYNSDLPELIDILSGKYDYIKTFGEYLIDTEKNGYDYHNFSALRIYLLKN